MASWGYVVPVEKEDEFETAFLSVMPVPIDPDTQEPIMGPRQWIKEAGRLWFLAKYRAGRRAQQVPLLVDPEIVE